MGRNKTLHKVVVITLVVLLLASVTPALYVMI